MWLLRTWNVANPIWHVQSSTIFKDLVQNVNINHFYIFKLTFLYNGLIKYIAKIHFSSFQLLSHVQLFATPWTAICQASLSIMNSQSLLKLMSIQLVMPSNHLILCCPLLLLPQSLPASGSFPMSQFFASGGESMELQLQHQSFQWILRTDFLYDWLVWAPWSPGVLKSLF